MPCGGYMVSGRVRQRGFISCHSPFTSVFRPFHMFLFC